MRFNALVQSNENITTAHRGQLRQAAGVCALALIGTARHRQPGGPAGSVGKAPARERRESHDASLEVVNHYALRRMWRSCANELYARIGSVLQRSIGVRRTSAVSYRAENECGEL